MSNSTVLDTTENCRYCLMCRHVCPVGNVTYKESLTPHGWAQMVALERRGLMEWDQESVDALYKCADCGSCESHCVTDQPLPDAIAAARNMMVEKKLAPESVRNIAEKLKNSSSIYGDSQAEPPSGKGNVALFIGDEADHFAPGTIDAVLKLLHASGTEPVLIGRGRNDGFIPASLGLMSEARELAKKTMDDLESAGAKTLLVLSPGTFYTFSRLYNDRLGIHFKSNVNLVEVLSLLADQAASGNLKLRKSKAADSYAYVDPAHSVRVKTRFETPRNLLDRVVDGNRVELFWRKERAYPGGNTALQFTHPEISEQLTASQLKDAADAGAKTIYTEDPGTYGHLSSQAEGFDIDVRNLYEFLAGQL